MSKPGCLAGGGGGAGFAGKVGGGNGGGSTGTFFSISLGGRSNNFIPLGAGGSTGPGNLSVFSVLRGGSGSTGRGTVFTGAGNGAGTGSSTGRFFVGKVKGGHCGHSQSLAGCVTLSRLSWRWWELQGGQVASKTPEINSLPLHLIIVDTLPIFILLPLIRQ